MASTVSLAELADLAVGSPQAGCVDFTALHRLLRALLAQLHLQEVRVGEPLLRVPPQDGGPTQQRQQREGNPAGSTPLPAQPSSKTPGALEERVHGLERRLDVLDALPDLPELLDGSKRGGGGGGGGGGIGGGGAASGGGRPGPVRDMWQLLQINKRLEANETAVSKAMSLLQELLDDINSLKSAKEVMLENIRNLRDQQESINANELKERMAAVEAYKTRIDELDRNLREQQNKLGLLPSPEEFRNCITYKFLQETLIPKGGTLQEAHATEIQPQHKEAAQALRVIGQLPRLHGALEIRVEALEADLQSVPNKSEMEALKRQLEDLASKNIPDNLLQQLKALAEDLGKLNGEKAKDAEALRLLQAALRQLQADCERLDSTTALLEEDKAQKQRHVNRLFELVEQLEEKKADKQHVEMEIDVKADKLALDGKVSRAQFDETAERLGAMVQELLSKLALHEHDWVKTLERLTQEMDSKLDRMDLDPLKKQLEDRWRAFKKHLQEGPRIEADDAAAFRKQLVARFNCLSCDRPVDLMPGPHIITLPATQGFPPSRSVRPYTVYDVGHIRHNAKSEKELAEYAYWASARPCGGSHTMTYTARRFNKAQNLNQVYLSQSVDKQQAYTKKGVDIMGLNGQIYKGRASGRLPDLQPAQPTEDFTTVEDDASVQMAYRGSRSTVQRRNSGGAEVRAVPTRPQSARLPPRARAVSARPSARERPTTSLGRLSGERQASAATLLMQPAATTAAATSSLAQHRQQQQDHQVDGASIAVSIPAAPAEPPGSPDTLQQQQLV
uniref:Uncharacterized protein C16orf96 homolog n=1 Tax=Petromyzon marinus TaxID=7757 RepID=A0AAJ7TFG8_PETMA|nr:uncharacterized protein C16orf96 homolog [Petromyzon marinus]